ncbi:MAG: hypothetical protein C1943_17870 [Halochromatium sp.]|nr:hypothetical protein [Halochromatium sp.]
MRAARGLLLIGLVLVFVLGALAISAHFGPRLLARWQDLQPRVTELAPHSAPPLAVQPAVAAAAALAALSRPLIGGGQLSVLGNPAALRYPDCHLAYARNPWDLAAFDGGLYIGLGDASNQGPSPNAGPVPLIRYDPVSDRFHEELILPEEQIGRFFRRQGALWLTGDDPRQSWRWGNLYRRDAHGGWLQYRTLPRTIHAYALAWHQGRLFAAISITEAVPEGVGTERHGSAVAVSTDEGLSWSLIPLGGWRIFDFLQLDGQLFAADVFPGPGIQRWLDAEQRQGWHAPIYALEMSPAETSPAETITAEASTAEASTAEAMPTARRRLDLDAKALFPNTPQAGERAAVVARALPWGHRAAYLGVFARWQDPWPEQGAYLAESLREGDVRVRRIPLPEGAIALDLRLEGNALQVLFAVPETDVADADAALDTRWRSSLWSSQDGERWEPMLSFSANAPARAVERLGDDLYLALGSLSPPDEGRCTAADQATGTLLRWRR